MKSVVKCPECDILMDFYDGMYHCELCKKHKQKTLSKETGRKEVDVQRTK